VDVSNLPCGLNGALYFSEMPADGGKSKFTDNNAGANFGTGYCDAQCPSDVKFINGESNSDGWNNKTGSGKYGSCCAEMDIWEANKISQAVTAHPCSFDGQERCEGDKCAAPSDCDKSGCDWGSYRNGLHNFFGPGADFAVDSSKPFTVITQFISEDGTDTGEVVEIKRKYVQNGKLIDNPQATIGGKQFDSITDDFCKAKSVFFDEEDTFTARGGMKKMASSLANGMTLVMSLWDDAAVHMLWLDSDYPTTKDPNAPGVARGTCPITSGAPADVRKNSPHSNVTFSDIRHGEIGSTFAGGPTPPGDKYKCESDQCVKSGSGVSIDICNANCGSDLYKCENNTCTKSTDGKGIDLASCKSFCGNFQEYLQ